MYKCSESASESGSVGSVCFWASRIRIQIRYSEVRIRGSGSASGSVPKCHGCPTLLVGLSFTAKQENTIFLIFCIMKFRMEQLQSHVWLLLTSNGPPHIWGNICAFRHILGSPSSYMTLQLLQLWISLYMEKILFLFYQCSSDKEKRN